MNVGAFLTRARALIAGAEDPGHDTPQEIAAMTEVESYARSTGPLGGGGTMVRAFGDAKKEITVWLSPHYDDPIILKVTAQRTLWAHADSEDDPNQDKWKRLDDAKEQNWASHKHAVAADAIIRRHFAAQLKASAPAPSKH